MPPKQNLRGVANPVLQFRTEYAPHRLAILSPSQASNCGKWAKLYKGKKDQGLENSKLSPRLVNQNEQFLADRQNAIYIYILLAILGISARAAADPTTTLPTRAATPEPTSAIIRTRGWRSTHNAEYTIGIANQHSSKGRIYKLHLNISPSVGQV